jgi:hypothetical protein
MLCTGQKLLLLKENIPFHHEKVYNNTMISIREIIWKLSVYAQYMLGYPFLLIVFYQQMQKKIYHVCGTDQ